MKVFCLLLFAGLSSAWAQMAPGLPQQPLPAMPDIPDEEVVAIFGDGTKLTMGGFKQIFSALPPNNQQMAMRNREVWLHQWELLRKLTKLAEDAKLDQESPYKESLEFGRMNVLGTGYINKQINNMVVEPTDIVKAYESNKLKYTQVRVKAIYIAFNEDAASSSTTKGKKPLTDAEAKAKAQKLLAAIRGGADFVKAVKENSDDETSRDKDGDFATLRSTDNIPDAFRATVFALKKGDVSEPLKQPNGYYLLRAEDITVRPLSEVRDDIYNDLKAARADEWLRGMDQNAKVQIVNPKFIGTPNPPAAAPPVKK